MLMDPSRREENSLCLSLAPRPSQLAELENCSSDQHCGFCPFRPTVALATSFHPGLRFLCLKRGSDSPRRLPAFPEFYGMGRIMFSNYSVLFGAQVL